MRSGCIYLLLAVSAICLASTVSAGPVGAGPGSGSTPQAAVKQPATPAPEARVDINHATVDELMQVPGMTGTWAARITRFRPYRTKQDLIDKGVVTSQVYDRIKDYVIAHQVADQKKN